MFLKDIMSERLFYVLDVQNILALMVFVKIAKTKIELFLRYIIILDLRKQTQSTNILESS